MKRFRLSLLLQGVSSSKEPLSQHGRRGPGVIPSDPARPTPSSLTTTQMYDVLDPIPFLKREHVRGGGGVASFVRGEGGAKPRWAFRTESGVLAMKAKPSVTQVDR